MTDIYTKILSGLFIFVGLIAGLLKFGSSMKKSGVDSEKLKQQAVDAIALGKKQQRNDENAQIEIDNSQLTTSELHDSVWTKPDSDS